jgi:hypothetical protein
MCDQLEIQNNTEEQGHRSQPSHLIHRMSLGNLPCLTERECEMKGWGIAGDTIFSSASQ